MILCINHAALIDSIKSIFIGAFQPQALAGGIAGVTVKEAMRYGVARGLFSNEAGMGSTPHAHALAKVKKPQDQGVIAMVGVFIDTFIILTLTALVILTSGALSTGATGSVLAQTAFNQAFGQFGSVSVSYTHLHRAGIRRDQSPFRVPDGYTSGGFVQTLLSCGLFSCSYLRNLL